jgi:hypothetical protein
MEEIQIKSRDIKLLRLNPVLQNRITIQNIVSNIKNKQRRSLTTQGSHILELEKLENLTNPNFKVYSEKVETLHKESINIYETESKIVNNSKVVLDLKTDNNLAIDNISIEINRESIKELRNQYQIDSKFIINKLDIVHDKKVDNNDLALKHTYTIDKTYEYLLEKLYSMDFYSMIAVVTQVCNSIIRYTFLTMPIVYAYLGLFYANLLILLVGSLSILTLFYMMKAHEITGHT